MMLTVCTELSIENMSNLTVWEEEFEIKYENAKVMGNRNALIVLYKMQDYKTWDWETLV